MEMGRSLILLLGFALVFLVRFSLGGFPDAELYHEALQDRKQSFPRNAKTLCDKKDEDEEMSDDKELTVNDDYPHKDVLLPKDILPEEYDIFLHPNLNTFKYNGTVKMLLRVEKDTPHIIFHQVGLNITSRKLEKVLAKDTKVKVPIKESMESKPLEQYLVKPTEELKAGKKYLLTLSFNGLITDELEGFYRSSYKTKAGEKKYMAVSDFEATDARRAFPCFDEPTMKAKFSISIVREKKHRALSNMPINKQVKRDDGLVEDHFGQTVKMSTYLVAFIISEFAYAESVTRHGTKIRAWAPKHLVHQTALALEVATKVLPFYEDTFQQKYALPKLDMIAIPDFAAGAMENWGLVTFATSALLCDKEKASPLAKQWVASVVAHEFAHQWFGNLVTLKWWSNLWLNEGFATYVEDFGVDHVRPGWDMMNQFIPRVLHRAMKHDEKSTSHPILVDVLKPAQIDKIFDTISYKKGASVNRMLESILGKEQYFSALRMYLEEHKFSIAETNDLWSTVSKATHNKLIKEIMDTWVKQMGFPVVTLDTTKNGKMVATQKKFCFSKCDSMKRSPYNYKWHIPLSYITESKKEVNQLTWLNATKDVTDISLDGTGWVKANIGQMGYYRVNYDINNWKKLGMQLLINHKVFTPADRANLLDDAFNLARAGMLPETTALELTAYLKNEEHYLPWKAALSAISYLDDMLVGSQAHPYYKKYMANQLEPMSKVLGWNDKGSHLTRMLKKDVFSAASILGSPSAVSNSAKLFKEWKEEQKEIPAALRQNVLDSAIRWGGEEEFDYVWKEYLNTDSHPQKHTYLFALPSTRNAKLLEKLFEKALDTDLVTKIDALYVFIYATSHATGREKVWELMKNKWDILKERYWKNRYFFSVLMRTAVGEFNSEEKLKEVEDFFKLRECDLTTDHLDVIEDAMSSIKENIGWAEKHGDELTEWFKSRGIDTDNDNDNDDDEHDSDENHDGDENEDGDENQDGDYNDEHEDDDDSDYY